VNFDRVWQWPKPIQRPHPPIIIGGNGPRTLRRVIDYGDGWGPIIGRGPSIVSRMAELASLAADAGRAPIPVTIFSLGASDDKLIEEYQAAGATRFIFGVRADTRDNVLPVLERYANLCARYTAA